MAKDPTGERPSFATLYNVGSMRAEKVFPTDPPPAPVQRSQSENTTDTDLREDDDTTQKRALARVQPVRRPAAPRARDLDALGTMSNRPPPPAVTSDVQRAFVIIERMSMFGPEEDAPGWLELQRLGPAALEALSDVFPGALWFSRRVPHHRPAAGRDVSRVARLMVHFGTQSVPYISALLADMDPDTRYYAALVAAEIPDPQLVTPLLSLLKDTDEGVSQVALRALLEFDDNAGRSIAIEQLKKNIVDRAASVGDRTRAMRALGILRETTAIGFLIEVLDEPTMQEQAARVLQILSGRNFRHDNGGWKKWWRKNERRDRITWLVDALTDDDVTNREIAIRELRRCTALDLPFDPHSDRSSRKRDHKQIIKLIRAQR
ncbi:MAG: HEAT repeat domain-containing protein [Polyangiales bacterium]